MDTIKKALTSLVFLSIDTGKQGIRDDKKTGKHRSSEKHMVPEGKTNNDPEEQMIFDISRPMAEYEFAGPGPERAIADIIHRGMC
jgi:hypothetical protein